MRPFLPAVALLSSALLLGCHGKASSPVAPESVGPQLHVSDKHPDGHGGGGKGDGNDKPTWTHAQVVLHPSTSPEAPALITVCDVVSGGDKPSLLWPRHDGCASIRLTESLELTDDPYLEIRMKAGKIVSVQFHEQDKIGAEGIQFESEVVLVTPQEFTGAGFTLHIDADNIPVYQLSGHTSGRRVAQVGVMYLGDVVYQ